MFDLHSLETSTLVDMLAEQTANYLQMLHNGSEKDEFEKCKLSIKAIQREIDFRKNIADIPSINITHPPDFS